MLDATETAAASDTRLFPTTFNQANRCKYLQRKPGILPNEVSALRLDGPLDETALLAALNGVVRRHGALRTTFPIVDGTRVQRVAENVSLTLGKYTASGRTPADQWRDVRKHIAELVTPPFDVERDILFRPFLITLSPERHVFGIVVDHIIVDAWALSIFWDEFLELYRAEVDGTASALPPAPQLGDYAVWERQRLSGQHLQRLETYWQTSLADLPPPIDWQTGVARPSPYTYRSRMLSWNIDSDLTEQLRSVARAQRVNVFAVLTAILSTLVLRFSSRDDFLMTTFTANRRRREVERLIGYVANAVALRIRATRDTKLTALLQHVHTVSNAALAHSDFPTAMMSKIVGLPIDASYGSRRQVGHMFSSVKRAAPIQIGELRAEPVYFDYADTKEETADHEPASSWTYDLMLISTERADGIGISLWYNRDVFPPQVAPRLLKIFQAATWELAREAVAAESVS